MIFCCLITRSRDTANIAVISGSRALRQAEHTISVQMQISDSGSIAEEVTLSQIIRAYHTHCRNISMGLN